MSPQPSYPGHWHVIAVTSGSHKDWACFFLSYWGQLLLRLPTGLPSWEGRVPGLWFMSLLSLTHLPPCSLPAQAGLQCHPPRLPRLCLQPWLTGLPSLWLQPIQGALSLLWLWSPGPCIIGLTLTGGLTPAGKHGWHKLRSVFSFFFFFFTFLYITGIAFYYTLMVLLHLVFLKQAQICLHKRDFIFSKSEKVLYIYMHRHMNRIRYTPTQEQVSLGKLQLIFIFFLMFWRFPFLQ